MSQQKCSRLYESRCKVSVLLVLVLVGIKLSSKVVDTVIPILVVNLKAMQLAVEGLNRR